MPLDEAIGILNRMRHDDCEWRAYGRGAMGRSVLRIDYYLTRFEVVAIAEKYQRDDATARDRSTRRALDDIVAAINRGFVVDASPRGLS